MVSELGSERHDTICLLFWERIFALEFLYALKFTDHLKLETLYRSSTQARYENPVWSGAGCLEHLFWEFGRISYLLNACTEAATLFSLVRLIVCRAEWSSASELTRRALVKFSCACYSHLQNLKLTQSWPALPRERRPNFLHGSPSTQLLAGPPGLSDAWSLSKTLNFRVSREREVIRSMILMLAGGF